MKILVEELFVKKPLPIVYIVTTNSYIRRDGSLVMGRGAALEATKRIPGIDSEAGKLIPHLGTYGFIIVRTPLDYTAGFGLFQVKYKFDDPADLELIKYSADKLTSLATREKNCQFRMNYPGIGFGHLTREVVEPLLSELPDNVTICMRR